MNRIFRNWFPARRAGGADVAAQRVLIVCDNADIHACKARDNAATALHYARIRFDVGSLRDMIALPRFGHYSCILLCAENLQPLDSRVIAEMTAFVRGGGGLAVIYRGWNGRLCDLFGIAAQDRWPEFVPEDGNGGLHFGGGLLPAFEGLHFGYDEMSGHVSYDVVPERDCAILATNDGGRPLAWLRQAGEGRVLFWNTAVLGEKIMRGLIVQSVACAQPRAVLPIANVAVIHIDDFPPPWIEETREPLSSEFPGMSPSAFFRDVWYGDMAALARKEGLVYTGYAIFDYFSTAADFENAAGKPGEALPPVFGERAAGLALGEGEIGLHGYNHVSLALDLWMTEDAMHASLAAARESWDTWHADMPPRSYVPPNNEFDGRGIRALSVHFPEIEAVCSTYTGGLHERGGRREFGPEPWNEALFSMPRASAGYTLDSDNHLEMASLLDTMGVWTHMIHPDDLFDTPERSPEAGEWRNPATRYWRATNPDGAEGLYRTFADWIAFAKVRFPWLRYMATSTAVPILKAFLENRYEIGFGDKLVSVRTAPGSYFRLRLNDFSRVNPAGTVGAELLHAEERLEFAVYTFRSQAGEATIELM